MAKLIVVALAFAALVAFASAYTTIVTTTIDDQIPYTQQSQQCQQQLQQKEFKQCHMYLQQGQGQGQGFFEDNRSGQQQQSRILQQCCNELQNVRQQCQCEAVKQVFQDAQQIQGQFGGSHQQIQQLKQRAQNLPNQCKLQVQQCPLPTVITTTTTIDDNRQSGSQSQQSCYQRIQQQDFQQCQRYIQQAQQSGPYGPFLMSLNRQGQQGQQLQQEMQQCCNELERVQTECQCEALQEVYRQAQQQQQQPWSQQQGSRRGGQQQQQQMQGVRSIVEQLRNQCRNLQAQQCQIPSAMF